MPSNATPATIPAAAAIERYLDALPVLSIEELTERTLTQTLNATTIEDVLKNPEAAGLEDYNGQVLRVDRIAGVLPSTYQTGPTRYVVIDCVPDTTGEPVSITCGSPYVMTRLFRAAELDAFPVRVRVIALESVSNPGQSSLWIVKP